MAGEGAIFAESVAFECLVFSVQCLMSGKEIDAKECLGLHTEVRHQNWSNPMTSSLEKAVRTLFGRTHDIDKREAIDKMMRTGLVMQQSQQSSGGEDDRPAFLRLLDYFDQDAEESEGQPQRGIHEEKLDYFDQDVEERVGDMGGQAKRMRVTCL